MNKDRAISVFKDGIINNNPTLVQLLGTCPTLAITTSVKNGIAMGISATVILVFSNLFISILRNFIPKQVRIASYIVIISGFVTAVELLIKAYLPEVDRSLGVFIPLIVVNCIILARAEAFASKNPPALSALDGLSMGLGFTLALTMISAFRELLGAGTFFGLSLLGEGGSPALIMIMPPGAFLALAFIIAFVNKLKKAQKKKKVAVTEPFLDVTKQEEGE